MPRPKGSWTGKANPNWNGGRYTTNHGYVFVKRPDHPNADVRGYVREHILVMSESIGRPIQSDEVVHHINGERSDNRLENLVLMKRSRHASHHHKGLIKPNSIKNLSGHSSEEMKRIWTTSRQHHRKKPRICDYCGGEFYANRNIGLPTHKHQFCNRQCYFAFRRQNIKDH